MDRMSGLPMIKCSSCGVNIDILQLADHICASAATTNTVPTVESPPPTPPKNARSESPVSPPKMQRAATLGGPSFSNRSDIQASSSRMRAPPRIDPTAANKPFKHLEPTAVGNQNDTRNRNQASLLPPKSPFMMNRSATSPVPRRKIGPPSPELPPNMDCAFPPFPRSATPQSAKPRPRDRLEPAPVERYAEPSPLFAPLSPRINGGENVTKRMDKIAPGPFDGRRPSASNSSTPTQEEPPLGHRRTNTQGSSRSFGSVSKQRTSVSSSTSRASAYSNRSVGLPARPKPGMNANNMPPPPLPKEPEQSEGIDAFLSRLQKESMGPSKPRNDSAAGVQLDRQGSNGKKEAPPRPRRPSERHLPTSDMIDEIRSTQTGPSHSKSLSRDRIQNGMAPRNGTPPSRPLQPPPLAPPPFRNDTPFNTLHTPSDSGLSDDSYASSGFRSVASSRSSPPGSDAGHSREASKISRTGYLDETLQRTTSPESFLESRTTPPRITAARGPGSYARLNAPQPASRSFSPDFANGPESPMDPAIQMGTAFDRRPKQSPPRRDPALGPDRTVPDPRPAPELRRQDSRPSSKGNCRGCTKPIVGKSVKDSSGRLTGRYHKQCFVCKTCNDSFPTAEFYVYENSPYCERHYHELNGSLCASCDRGIEGQYLETDDRRKFHPRCFTCTTCRIVLRDDYFEVAGKKYCDRHAQHAAAPSQNLLGPGGYRPRMEKRRTRLMMMA